MVLAAVQRFPLVEYSCIVEDETSEETKDYKLCVVAKKITDCVIVLLKIKCVALPCRTTLIWLLGGFSLRVRVRVVYNKLGLGLHLGLRLGLQKGD